MEAVFQRVPGVRHSVSGYSGGKTEHPTYEDICSHGSGHAEVIQVEFSPAIISYEKLLEIFFEAHDPTTLNRQGADHGDQYRSVIFFHDEAQHQAASLEEERRAVAQLEAQGIRVFAAAPPAKRPRFA